MHASKPIKPPGAILIMLAACAFSLLTSVGCSGFSGGAPVDRYIRAARDGAIFYPATPEGDRIPDFSNAGYMGGGAPLPDVPVAETVRPGPGDDGRRIQEAIDRVSTLPSDPHGFRGAVLLTKGEYRIRGSLAITASGVVLRGEGDDSRGTTLIAIGRDRRPLIVIGGGLEPASLQDGDSEERPARPNVNKPREVAHSRRAIVDDYVPVGARSFRIEDPSPFKVGDAVIVHRPSTESWISEIGMDRIPPRKDGGETVQWRPGSRDLFYDRIITAVQGGRITVDAPLCDAIDRRFGGGSIYRYEFPQRISQVGVERLRGVSDFEGERDEDHSWTFIHMDAAQNAWVKDVTAEHFAFSLVTVARYAKWVTVEDCRCLDPVSRVEGGRRYSYSLIGQLTLFRRCYSRGGRHDFVPHDGEVCGPDVFLDCQAEGALAESGPHGRWCTGVLFDNVRIGGNDLVLTNHGNAGTGHGWAAANCVLWNCRAEKIGCENPPTARNWSIGCKCRKAEGGGDWASESDSVKPRSLYLRQLEDRLRRDERSDPPSKGKAAP